MASRSSNRAAVPEAKSALDRFKYEVASEIGVPLKDGCSFSHKMQNFFASFAK